MPCSSTLKPTHRFHAREAASAHYTHKPTETKWEHELHHTVHKTEAPKKTGGWGFPW